MSTTTGWGPTTAGFLMKRAQDIKTDFRAAFAAIYTNPNLSDTSVIGQKIASMTLQLAQAWEGLQIAYNAPFPSLTDLGSIDNVLNAAGLSRLPATATTIYCDCVCTGAVTISTSDIIQDPNGNQYSPVVPIVATGAGTFSGYFACTKTGPVVCSDGSALTIQTPESGWSTVSLHPYTTVVTDNGGTFTAGSVASTLDGGLYIKPWSTNKNTTMGLIATQIAAAFSFVVSATYNGTGHTITIISTLPFTLTFDTSGVTGTMTISSIAQSASTTTTGRNIESLASARIRYKNSTMIAGSATLNAIRAAILNNVSTVTSCNVGENISGAVDSDGALDGSIKVVVQGTQSPTEELAIANQIWAKRAGGIKTFGTVSQAIVDEQGAAQTVSFSYVTAVAVTVYVTYSLFTDETPPNDIHAAITAAVTTLFSSFALGEDVLIGRVQGACYSVPGIKSIVVTLNGGSSDIAITASHIGQLSSVTF